jgi:hypothetical protein
MTRRTHFWIFVAISIAAAFAVLASPPANTQGNVTSGTVASAGPRDEPFFVDLGRVPPRGVSDSP